MRSVETIYKELKSYYESVGSNVDDARLRQMAWMKRDRLMFENLGTKSNSFNAVSSGGSSYLKRVGLSSPLNDPFTIDSGEEYTIEGDLVLNATLTIQPGGTLNVKGSIVNSEFIVNNGGTINII